MALGNIMSGVAGGATVAIVIKGVDQYSAEFNKASTSMRQLGTVMKAVGVAAATGLAAFGIASVKAAAESEAISKQFRNLTHDTDNFLESLNNATHETVSNFELMSSANKALLLGLSQDELPEFFEKAAILGQAAGRSVTEAVSDITLGVGRQSKLILDNLGIMVDAQKAYDDYAASLGKTASQLDETEKKAAFFKATLEGMNATIRENGMQFEMGFSEKLAQMNKGLEDFKVTVGNELLPVLSEMATILNENSESFSELGKAAGLVLKGIVIGISETLKNLIYLGDTVGNIIATVTDALSSLTKGDFEGAGQALGRGENRQKFLKAGLSGEEAATYGNAFTVDEYIGQKTNLAAEERIRQQALQEERMIASSAAGDPGGGTTIEKLFENINMGTESVTENTNMLDTQSTAISDNTNKISLNNIEMEKLADYMLVLENAEVSTAEEAIKLAADMDKAKQVMNNLSEGTKSAVYAIKEFKSGLSTALNYLPGYKKIKTTYGDDSFTTTRKSGNSNVEYNQATGKWVAAGSKDDTMVGFNQTKASVVNNYYTQDNSANVAKLTGT